MKTCRNDFTFPLVHGSDGSGDHPVMDGNVEEAGVNDCQSSHVHATGDSAVVGLHHDRQRQHIAHQTYHNHNGQVVKMNTNSQFVHEVILGQDRGWNWSL